MTEFVFHGAENQLGRGEARHDDDIDGTQLLQSGAHRQATKLFAGPACIHDADERDGMIMGAQRPHLGQVRDAGESDP